MTPQALAARIEIAWMGPKTVPFAARLREHRRGWTAEIKSLMGDLGRNLNYQVAALALAPPMLPYHFENCKKQVSLFGGTRPDDQYVCVFFEWKEKKMHIRRIPAA